MLTHAQTVCTRLSFPPTKESLGSRLAVTIICESTLCGLNAIIFRLKGGSSAPMTPPWIRPCRHPLLDDHSSHFELQPIQFAKENSGVMIFFVFHRTPRMSASPLMLVFLDHSRGTGSKNAIDFTKATRLILLISTLFFVKHGTKLS